MGTASFMYILMHIYPYLYIYAHIYTLTHIYITIIVKMLINLRESEEAGKAWEGLEGRKVMEEMV